MFGGNAHNALTLIEHPRPFDFILPDAPSLPRIPGTELLPYRYIETFIRNLAQLYINNMICLRNAVTEPVIHLESPPPVGDNVFVLNHLEQYFKDQSATPRIAPSVLRYKLWCLHSGIISNACMLNSVEFVPTPRAAMDEQGYLVPIGYADDSTHAGPWYGGVVLRELEERLGVRYNGWDWLF